MVPHPLLEVSRSSGLDVVLLCLQSCSSCEALEGFFLSALLVLVSVLLPTYAVLGHADFYRCETRSPVSFNILI